MKFPYVWPKTLTLWCSERKRPTYEIAKECRVYTSTVRRWRVGNHIPEDKLEFILEVTGLPFEDFLPVLNSASENSDPETQADIANDAGLLSISEESTFHSHMESRPSHHKEENLNASNKSGGQAVETGAVETRKLTATEEANSSQPHYETDPDADEDDIGSLHEISELIANLTLPKQSGGFISRSNPSDPRKLIAKPSNESRPLSACQYPVQFNDSAPRKTIFCCAPVKPGRSYCAEHMEVCFETRSRSHGPRNSFQSFVNTR